MKGKIGASFGVLILLAIALGCSHGHDHDRHDEPSKEAVRTYLLENYPTRDQILRVQQCVTKRTGYEFPKLPDDFGPEYLTKERPKDDPKPPSEVYDAHLDCVFYLGLEDRFFPPWDHDDLRPSDV